MADTPQNFTNWLLTLKGTALLHRDISLAVTAYEASTALLCAVMEGIKPTPINIIRYKPRRKTAYGQPFIYSYADITRENYEKIPLFIYISTHDNKFVAQFKCIKTAKQKKKYFEETS